MAQEFDLDQRTFNFAKGIRSIMTSAQLKRVNSDDKAQLLRSSGSVGANYIEANEAISHKDFLLRIKICRKEAKESHYWLRLLKDSFNETQKENVDGLIEEALQLARIFGAIINKCERR